jgi:hypothetical protein
MSIGFAWNRFDNTTAISGNTTLRKHHAQKTPLKPGSSVKGATVAPAGSPDSAPDGNAQV